MCMVCTLYMVQVFNHLRAANAERRKDLEIREFRGLIGARRGNNAVELRPLKERAAWPALPHAASVLRSSILNGKSRWVIRLKPNNGLSLACFMNA